MISQPYEKSQIRVQSIIDCTEAPTVIFGGGGNNLLLVDSGAIPSPLITIADPQMETVLHIDVDRDGVVPMVVREQGYEWVPVYTRKLT